MHSRTTTRMNTRMHARMHAHVSKSARAPPRRLLRSAATFFSVLGIHGLRYSRFRDFLKSSDVPLGIFCVWIPRYSREIFCDAHGFQQSKTTDRNGGKIDGKGGSNEDVMRHGHVVKREMFLPGRDDQNIRYTGQSYIGWLRIVNSAVRCCGSTVVNSFPR